MELDLNKITNKLEHYEFLKNFIKELNNTLKNFNTEKQVKDEYMKNIELTSQEELEFDRQQFKFLQDYFKNKETVFIVTDKYEKDIELHRYKVTQYKNNFECKYIAFEKDLPKNVKIGDVVRKQNDIYIYDEKATKYIKNSIERIKQDILNKRNK